MYEKHGGAAEGPNVEPPGSMARDLDTLDGVRMADGEVEVRSGWVDYQVDAWVDGDASAAVVGSVGSRLRGAGYEIFDLRLVEATGNIKVSASRRRERGEDGE